VPTLPGDQFDAQFERYLKQFRPLAPEKMPLEEYLPTRWRPRVLASWAAVAAVAIVAFLILYPRVRRPDERDVQWTGVADTQTSQPLTIRSANALLDSAPSFKVAVDALAVPFHTTSLGSKQSALDVLSKDSQL
jgi:hypothetical protein